MNSVKSHKNQFHYLIVLVIVFIYGIDAYSKDINIENINLKDGLPNNSINSIIQDTKGFVWFGTDNGLYRYDGYEFKNISSGEEIYSISNLDVLDIRIDTKERLWFTGLNKGIFCYNTDDEQFVNFKFLEKIRNENVRTIEIIGDSILLAGTSSGLIIASSKDGFLAEDTKVVINKVFFNVDEPLSNKNNIISIKKSPDTLNPVCFIGTNVSLFSYNLRSKTHKLIPAKGKVAIRDIFFLSNGNKVIAFWSSGVILLDLENNVIENELSATLNKYLENYRVLSINETNNNDIWIGTDGNGLFHFQETTERIIVDQYKYEPEKINSIGSNEIFCILKDKSDILWIGHRHGGGITKIDRGKRNVNTINNIFPGEKEYYYIISAIDATNDSTLWVSTLGSGLSYYNLNTGTGIKLQNSSISLLDIKSNQIQKLFFDTWGNAWLGTSGKGIIIIPYSTIKSIETGSRIINKSVFQINSTLVNNFSNYVFDINQDLDGNIWIGTHRGLFKISLNNKLLDISSIEDLINEIKIENVFEDDINLRKTRFNAIQLNKNRVIYVCTKEEGLVQIKYSLGEKLRYSIYKHIPYRENTISSNETYNGTFDEQNNFWIATASGIDKLNQETNTISRVLFGEDIGKFQIQNLVFDSNGHIWAALNYGFLKLDTISRKTIKFIDPIAHKNYYSEEAYFQDDKGVIYFGSRNSIAFFHPTELIDSSITVSLHITDLKINNIRVLPKRKINGRIILTDNINKTSELLLKNKDKNISLDIATLDYRNSNILQFRYKFKEDEEDLWTTLSPGQRTISFSNLKFGTHTLQISNTNSEGVWSSVPREIRIKVLPPPLSSSLALIIYIISFIGIFIISQRFWMIRLKEKNALKIVQIEKQQADNLHNLKIRFFMNISHEFRTPLSLILAPLEILKEKIKDSESNHSLHIIMRNANRLLYLVNQIIDIRKLDNDKLSLELNKINVSKFAESILYLFDIPASKKDICLEFETSSKDLLLIIDPIKIETVFYNLISNALRYTPKNGRVKVKISHDMDNCIIEVIDNGVGISPDQFQYVFERFHYSPSLDGSMVGAGIGLSHSKSLVELHNGSIEFKSMENKGTTFIVKLPLVPQNINANEISEISIKDFISQIQGIVQNEYSDIEAEQFLEFEKESNSIYGENTQPQSPVKKDYSLVLAEDNNDLRIYLHNYLSERFENVNSFSNGKDAIEYVRNNDVDIVVSDVMMPIMDGLEMCRLIKNNNDLKHVFIILVTAKNYEHDKISAIEDGADVYIFKPFSLHYLMLRIEKLIEQKENLEGHASESVFTILKKKGLTNVDKLFIDKGISLVEENISNADFNIDNMCQELNVSRAQLYRKMNKLTGLSVKEFIKEIRLQRATQILKEDNVTVNEVSYMCGFGSPTYFSNCFKKKYGVSPYKYKAKNYKTPFVNI